jgi:hypothetical protein
MFLRDGFRVTGIDLDRMMIEAASAVYHQGVFRCMDIAEIRYLHGPFQLVYSIGNVLAHLSLEKLETFLGDVYAALNSGSYWVLQVVNWDYLLTLKDYSFPVKTIAAGSMTFHRRYSQISPEGVVFEVQLTAAGTILFNEQSKLYPLTSDVLLQLHQAAGFSLEGIYAGFDKTEYRTNIDSGLIMVFSKP